MTKYMLNVEYQVEDDDTAMMVASEAVRSITTGALRVNSRVELIAEAKPPWMRTRILWAPNQATA